MHHVTRIARRGVFGLLLLALLAAVGCKSAAGHTRGEQLEDHRPKIVTVFSENRGVQRVIPGKENLPVYSARRAARLAGPVGRCLIERGDETVEANFKTVLERGDVLRFQR